MDAFADPDTATHGKFQTSIFLPVLFSVLLLGFVAIAVLLLPLDCLLSNSPECRTTVFNDPM